MIDIKRLSIRRLNKKITESIVPKLFKIIDTPLSEPFDIIVNNPTTQLKIN